MAPFRLFAKRPASGLTLDTPDSTSDPAQNSPVGSLSRRSREDSPSAYKMSVVNDSGVYLPPSPTDEDEASFWGGRSPIKHHNLVDENEPFCMTRESFDSYRRSFDISARSPVHSEATTRTSLDSRLDARPARFMRPTNLRNSLEAPEEEKFEDVGLDDNKDATTTGNTNTSTSFVSGLTGGRLSSFMHSRSQTQTQTQPQPQSQPTNKPKRSFFSRFSTTTPNQANDSTESLSRTTTTTTTDNESNKESLASSAISALFPGSSNTATTSSNKETNAQTGHSVTSHLPFHLGRKRAQSNASNVQELGDMSSATDDEKSKSEETSTAVTTMDAAEKN
ncbi:hypothetical protein AAP_05179 [Ascosphaera apis ARSEF 7405]|uniref:Uncharacterized protein n=1 Tax=Ascosphaera apis ARSEF 7405 TaxID=392613 RepID=A0A167VWZ5_9EURO|nr:hypothetical protein AAP_05179 [Ascosphaera apis ARSEF 7405]